MNCMLCPNQIKGFGGIKIYNGQICKECASKLPSLIVENAKNMSYYTLQIAYNYVVENKKRFRATSSYGKLHIDEIHGLFAIADKLDEDGKPKTGCNVFAACDLTEIGLCSKNPRIDHNMVNIDIELTFSLENPKCTIVTCIKKGVHCKQKRVDSSHVTWEEPGDLEMFRTLFNNMLEGTVQRVNEYLCGKTVYDFELEKARALFMLTEDYTAEELKKARRLMMKVYHPDTTDVDVSREVQIINNAHLLLKEHLVRKEIEK